MKLPWAIFRATMTSALMTLIERASENAIAAASAVGLRFKRDAVTGAIAKMAPAYIAAWLEEIERTTAERINAAMLAYESGEISADEVAARVALVFDPARAELMGVTETTRLFSVLNEVIYNAAGVERQRFDTVRDPWVCEECGAYDGMVFAVDDPDAPEIPVHVHCRCFWAPVAADIEIAA